MEQLVARQAHNPEAGSNPSPQPTKNANLKWRFILTMMNHFAYYSSSLKSRTRSSIRANSSIPFSSLLISSKASSLLLASTLTSCEHTFRNRHWVH